MKQTNLLKTFLLLCALVVGSTCAWADDEEIATATFNGKNAIYTEGWTTTGTGVGRTDCIIIGNGENITSPAFNLSGYSKVTISIKARRYGSLSGSKATIDASIGGSSVGTTDATTTNATTGCTDITFIPTASMTAAVLVFTCTNATSAGSTHGAGINTITITGTTASTATLESITLSGTYPTSFIEGDAFSHEGMTVTANYDNDSHVDVTNSATFTGYDMNTVGNQTVTVSFGGKTATYNITVNAAPSKVVTLDMSSNTNWGFPTSKTDGENSYTQNGYTITLDGAGNGYYFDTTNNNLLLGKTDATMTLPAFGFKVSKILVYGDDSGSAAVTFNIYDGEDAASTQVKSSKETQTFIIASEHQAIGKVYTIKVTNNNNMRISKIEVYGYGCEVGVVSDAGWATYVTPCNMEFAEGDAFVVSAATASTATLAPVTKIGANKAVLLKGEGAKTATVLNEAPEAVTNELAISNGGSVDGFVLAKKNGTVGFYKWNGGSLTSGKVYLPTPAGARDYLEFSFDDTTSLTLVNSEKSTVNNEYYNLAGQRVAQPTKGLYIVNGRKVVIK